jgi:hypothetical protein
MKELELLCSMKEVSFDGNDLENMVLSLRLVTSLACPSASLTSHLGAQDTTGPVPLRFFRVVGSPDTQLSSLVSRQLWLEL